MLTAAGGGCCALAVLLVIVDIHPGGCLHIISSASQEGKQLNLICTVWHKKEEAEGFIIYLCKNRPGDCSPETSLMQLRLKRDSGIDGRSEQPSQLVFTIHQVTPSDKGTYQCCARNQMTDVLLQGHFFSVLVTEDGNYTVEGLRQGQPPKFTHRTGTLSAGFRLGNVWAVLLTSLVALRAL
ncbi:CD160 antigen [Tupaia chinensis]|uniref:CD160 antigen n=1 Tax=Tupaia chinensis TaxID=246437 RepID=UPI0003C906A4|nr:CD160 antigen [Tupaia chinensis]